MLIAGKDGLTVMENEGEIGVFERSKFKKEVIVLQEFKLFPLIRIDTVEESTTRMIRNFLKNREEGVKRSVRHSYTDE